MGRVALIGDVGGHRDQLADALRTLGGAGSDGYLPQDLTVIQVGDLVDRGPDSSGVLALVGDHLRHQPDQWIQLVGNHEAQYLPGQSFFWPERLPGDDALTLREWWSSRAMNVATAVRTVDGDDLLVTHAGLTVDAWRALGEPATASAAARLLNARPEPLTWLGGDLAVDEAGGPLWADAGWELHEPWLGFHGEGGFVPFGQVHGHSCIVSYRDACWHCPGRVRQRATVDWKARHVTVRVGGRAFIGIDPKHGRHGAPEWAPLLLDDAVVLTE